jgi:hypothetical protein
VLRCTAHTAAPASDLEPNKHLRELSSTVASVRSVAPDKLSRLWVIGRQRFKHPLLDICPDLSRVRALLSLFSMLAVLAAVYLIDISFTY